MTQVNISYLPAGDTGLTVQFEGDSPRATNARALQLHRLLAEKPLPGVIETVPTFRSLTVHYDPGRTSQAELVDGIGRLSGDLDGGDLREPDRWRLPVCFDQDGFAPDLQEVARQTGLSTAEILDALTGTVQSVYMLGFAPGQPYLGDLPEALSIPRRQNPVGKVRAGSVLTATARTVVYPVENPTGWYVVGCTPLPLFRPDDEFPTLLQPGDEVVFEPISKNEFQRLYDQRERYRLTPETGRSP